MLPSSGKSSYRKKKVSQLSIADLFWCKLLMGLHTSSGPVLLFEAWRRLESDSGGENEGDPEQCHLLLSSENK